MSRSRLDGLKVLVVGIEELISRDVVRSLVADGAIATAASDERAVARLQRDLGVYRTTVSAAPVELYSPSEMRLFAANLRGLGALPHLIVCCCRGGECPTAIAAPLLEPTLVLHAAPRARSWLGRLAANFASPTLPALLERRGLFNPAVGPRRVRIGAHLFVLNRWDSARAPARRVRPSGDRPPPERQNRRGGGRRGTSAAMSPPSPQLQDAP